MNISEEQVKQFFIDKTLAVDKLSHYFTIKGLDNLYMVGEKLHDRLVQYYEVVNTSEVKEIILKDIDRVLANLETIVKTQKLMIDGFKFNLN